MVPKLLYVKARKYDCRSVVDWAVSAPEVAPLGALAVRTIKEVIRD